MKKSMRLYQFLPYLLVLFLTSYDLIAQSSAIWTGVNGADWSDASNWNLSFVPDVSTDTIIIPDVTNDPIASGIQIVIGNGCVLRIESGATLTVNSKGISDFCLDNEGIIVLETNSLLKLDSSKSDALSNGDTIYNHGAIEIGFISDEGYISSSGIVNVLASSFFGNYGDVSIQGLGKVHN